ncbi:hypothetical protein ZWY2020_038206 [Hordeum vulgare]|nr:hypothetical protein ZWY2020_038206 [Hordeum vulgare]
MEAAPTHHAHDGHSHGISTVITTLENRSRNTRRGFARNLAWLPTSFREGLACSIARGTPRSSRPRSVQVHQQHQPPPPGPPPPPFVPEELFFFSAFEQQYDGRHPFFYGCRLSEVLAIARREGKHVFLYLHEPGHPYTDPFCRGTLCSDVVVEFLDATFVSWGAVTGRGRVRHGRLAAARLPFCAVVARCPAKASQSSNG